MKFCQLYNPKAGDVFGSQTKPSYDIYGASGMTIQAIT